jgi:hypothetical protein
MKNKLERCQCHETYFCVINKKLERLLFYNKIERLALPTTYFYVINSKLERLSNQQIFSVVSFLRLILNPPEWSTFSPP